MENLMNYKNSFIQIFSGYYFFCVLQHVRRDF